VHVHHRQREARWTRLLFATDKVIARRGGELAKGANLLVGALGDCIKILKKAKESTGTGGGQ